MGTAEVGGGAEHLVQLVRGLLAHGFSSAAAFGRDGPAVGRLRTLEAEVRVVGTLRFTGARKLAALFRDTPADLIHLHGSRAGYLGARAAERAQAPPIVYTAHAFSFKRRLPDPLRRLAVQAEQLTCRVASHLIVLNPGDRDAAARIGIPSERVSLIPNGIAAERYLSAATRRHEFGYGAATPVVGTVGRLVEGKDPLAFVELAERVAAARPDARFLLVGDGPLRRKVERAVRRKRLQDRLRLTGFRDDVPALLATMDVAVFPSLWEALPLAVLEAMAAARAIVATDVSGHRALIVDREHGLLVPLHDEEGLGAATLALLDDVARRERLGSAARARVLADYTVQRMVEATAAVYEGVLVASR